MALPVGMRTELSPITDGIAEQIFRSIGPAALWIAAYIRQAVKNP